MYIYSRSSEGSTETNKRSSEETRFHFKAVGSDFSETRLYKVRVQIEFGCEPVQYTQQGTRYQSGGEKTKGSSEGGNDAFNDRSDLT